MNQLSVEHAVEDAAEVFRGPLQLHEDSGEQLLRSAFGRGHTLCQCDVKGSAVDGNRRCAEAVTLVVFVRRSHVEEENRAQRVA
jgi:hypothetical protein